MSKPLSPLAERFCALPGPRHAAARPSDAGLRLRVGGLKDYAVLAEHHYKAKRPATATRVLVLEDPRPTVVGRYLQRADTTVVVGVLIESLPSLSCRMRDWALHERYGGHLAPRSRAIMLNSELRCISRVVIDPRWRGLGLAVRLVRRALELCPRLVEHRQIPGLQANALQGGDEAGVVAVGGPGVGGHTGPLEERIHLAHGGE
ncbi:MAG: hypothetical protein AAGL98_11010, partial [Planctomycetota bacterium]